jgi:hypothetical protein
MIVKNANTLAHGDIQMVVLAHLQRRWSLSGREGFGILSPSHRACEVGFDTFMGMKRLFSFAPKARKGGEVVGVFLIEKHSLDTTLDAGF